MRLYPIAALLLVAALACPACHKKESAPSAAKASAPEKVVQVQLSLSDAEKQSLLEVARQAFDLYVREGKRLDNAKPSQPSLSQMKSNNVFATIYKDGEWRGCVSGSGANVVEATINAVIATCKDKRFKNPTPEELDHFRLELSLLQPEEPVDTKDPAEIGKRIEPGVHGITIKHTNGRQAFFLPYVFVKNQRPVTAWLERLCVKAGLEKDAWQAPEASIFRYATINFIEEKAHGKALDLYRYKVVLKGLAPSDIDNAVALTNAWYVNRLDEGGADHLPTALGLPPKDAPADSPDAQLFGMLALAEAADYGRDLPLAARVEKTLAPLVAQAGPPLAVIDADSFERLVLWADLCASSAVLTRRHERAQALFTLLADAMAKGKDVPESGRLYPDLPNAALDVLLRLVPRTKRPQDMSIAHDLVRARWRSGKEYSLPAIVSAVDVLADQVSDELAVKEIKALLDKQMKKGRGVYDDYLGAFGRDAVPTVASVALPLRALARYALIGHSTDAALNARLEEGVVMATRWLLEQQFTAASAFYLPDYATYLGAFKHDILVHTSYTSDTALALRALLGLQHDADRLMNKALPTMQDKLYK